MPNDPAIDEIRRVRHQISREAGHDLQTMKKSLAQLESQFQRPPVNYGGQRTTAGTRAAKPEDREVE